MLKNEIEKCTVCAPSLKLGPRPIVAFNEQSKIVIIGQAPGLKVHQTGIPWHDKSGENLRSWMGISEETFYDESQIGILPMGFCYPGKGKSGDNPPRSECAPLWHEQVLDQVKNIHLILLIGMYAQSYYLKGKQERTLTETVKNYKTYLPEYFVLPHPSPRNNIWMKKNPWFGEEVLPELKKKIHKTLANK